MRVFSYDKETGLLKGETVADKSPKDEGDVFLVPAFATAVEPPEDIPVGMRAKWDGAAWAVEAIPSVPVQAQNPSDVTQRMLAVISARVSANLREVMDLQVDALTDGSAAVAKAYKTVRQDCGNLLADLSTAADAPTLIAELGAAWPVLVDKWDKVKTITVPAAVLNMFDDLI